MQLDRNLNGGLCKYQVTNLRTGEVLKNTGPGEENEFFVVMLKDIHAKPAMHAYAGSAEKLDLEYGKECRELDERSGVDIIYCKVPD